MSEAIENPAAGNDGAPEESSSWSAVTANANDSHEGSSTPVDASAEDEGGDDFFLRRIPLHEVAHLTIEKQLASEDFAAEMEDARRAGHSVLKQAGLRMLHKVNNGIVLENRRRDSFDMKYDLLMLAGGTWPDYETTYDGGQRKLTIDEALRKAGARMPKLKPIENLDEAMTARILMKMETIIKIDLAGQGEHHTAPLAIYNAASGLYVTDEGQIRSKLTSLNPGLSGRQPDSAMERLRDLAPLTQRTRAARYIPVNNGIFDHQKQELLDFSPEFVFLTKSPVDYVADAQSPVITQPDGTTWDFDSWIESLSDDEGIPQLLWEGLSAVMRPGVRYDQALMPYSPKGRNGKGTYCQVARNLKGEKGYASLPISRFDKPFALTPLMHADAIITDENPVGVFSRELDVFKSVITGDVFTLERKHKDPYNARFEGVMIQCLNDLPKSSDKSASLTRRQLFVPFNKSFTGVENKAIKQDYLTRPDVLQYVLRRCLEMTHTEFSNPPACKEVMARFKQENNPVVEFWHELKDRFVWDMLPIAFLYDLYKAWFGQSNPSGTVVNKTEFKNRIVDAAEAEGWKFKTGAVRPGKRMAAPEHLIHEFSLEGWMNPKAKGSADLNKKCAPVLKREYYGALIRDGAAASDDAED